MSVHVTYVNEYPCHKFVVLVVVLVVVVVVVVVASRQVDRHRRTSGQYPLVASGASALPERVKLLKVL